MAPPKTIYTIAFVCLLILPFLSQTSWAHPNVHKSSPFQFIKYLEGSKKGDRVENLHKLKKYLHHFGYLNDIQLNNPETLENIDNNHFDETVETAIKTYQLNFNLQATGTLDSKTVSMMMKPRCGVPDIVNGRTRMNSAGKYNLDYALFDGEPKWPLSNGVLNWGLQPGTRRDIINPVSNYSLVAWTGIVPFTFNFVDENVSIANITIGFADQSTGMPKGALGIAFYPVDGHVFLSSEVKWTDGNVTPGTFDIGTVALHELGHALGLNHSSVQDAVMWPYIGSEVKGLHDDDYQGMKALYGI